MKCISGNQHDMRTKLISVSMIFTANHLLDSERSSGINKTYFDLITQQEVCKFYLMAVTDSSIWNNWLFVAFCIHVLLFQQQTASTKYAECEV